MSRRNGERQPFNEFWFKGSRRTEAGLDEYLNQEKFCFKSIGDHGMCEGNGAGERKADGATKGQL